MRHEALSFTDGGERPSISSPSRRRGEAGGSLNHGSVARAGAASDKDGPVQDCRMGRARWARREGIREEPAALRLLIFRQL